MVPDDGGNGTVHVLLVEDNPGDVRLATEAFERVDGGLHLHVVNDGDQALDFLYRQDEYADAPDPGFVLLDLNLPGRNGRDVLRTIKSDESLRHTPVIVFTSSDAEEDVRDVYDEHANAFITKPMDLSRYMDVIEEMKTFWVSVATLPPGNGKR
jgi:CheY-like chemotaxis protein